MVHCCLNDWLTNDLRCFLLNNFRLFLADLGTCSEERRASLDIGSTHLRLGIGLHILYTQGFFLSKLLIHERVVSRIDLGICACKLLAHDRHDFLFSSCLIGCHLLCCFCLLLNCWSRCNLLLAQLAKIAGVTLTQMSATMLYILIKHSLSILGLNN